MIVRVTRHDTNPGGRVDSIYWDIGANGTVDSVKSDSSIVLSFSQPATIKVAAWAKDNDGFLSQPDTETIIVKADYPYFGNRPDTATYINVPCMLRDPALPGASGVPIVQYYWYVVNDNVRDTTAGDSLSYTFRTATSYTIVVSCRDAGNVTSAPDTFHVTVDQGRPYFSAVSLQPGADSLFVVSPIRFTLAANDPNGSVDSFKVSWHGDTIFAEAVKALSQAAIFSHTFASGESGGTVVRFRAVGNDGLIRDTILAVTIRLGRPVVTGATTDTPLTRIFINDPVTFTVSAFDTNGTADSMSVDNGTGAFGPWQKTVGSEYSFGRTFSRTEAGPRTVRARAKDNNGFVSDTFSLPITVRLGAPVVDSVIIDTSKGNIFVRDLRTFTVYAHDTNGTIRTVYATWNGGSNADDSVQVNAGKSFGSLTHAYDTALFGPRTARFWVRDNDTLVSNTFADTIMVRLAPPVLWGDAPAATGDTTWVIINNGYDKSYSIHINSYDTNGVNQKPVRYYWQGAGQPFDTTQAEQPGIFRKTNQDTVVWPFTDMGTANQSRQLWIYGRDDDGLLGGGKFVVFADSAPRPMTATYNNSQTKFQWSGLDAKDSLATEYRILVKKGSQLGAGDTTAPFIAKDWTPGSDPAFSYTPANALPFTWIFTPIQGSGLYYFQIIARDKRGSISALPLSGANVFSY